MKGDHFVIVVTMLCLMCFAAGAAVSGEVTINLPAWLSNTVMGIVYSLLTGAYIATVTVRYQEFVRLSEMARDALGKTLLGTYKWEENKGEEYTFTSNKKERDLMMGGDFALAVKQLSRQGFYMEARFLKNINMQVLSHTRDVYRLDAKATDSWVKQVKEKCGSLRFPWYGWTPFPLKWLALIR